MSDKYVADNSYTDAELLLLYREALARISVSGQSYQASIGGGTRMFTSADLNEVQGMISWLENRIDMVSAANGGAKAVNYAKFARG